MTTYKKIEIIINNIYVETKGLNPYLDKEIRVPLVIINPKTIQRLLNILQIILQILNRLFLKTKIQAIIHGFYNLGWIQITVMIYMKQTLMVVVLIKVVIQQFQLLGLKGNYVGNKILFLFFQPSISQLLYQMVSMKGKISKE